MNYSRINDCRIKCDWGKSNASRLNIITLVNNTLFILKCDVGMSSRSNIYLLLELRVKNYFIL